MNKERIGKGIPIAVLIKGDNAVYLKGLKKLGLNMTSFVADAIKHYIPYYLEKLEVLIRYKKTMENYSPNMNEEKNEISINRKRDS